MDVPERIDASNAADQLRIYHSLARDSSARGPLRRVLVAYLDDEAGQVVASGDVERIAAHTMTLIDLCTPEDLDQGDVPTSLRPLAQALVERGERLGQEGRVLAGLRILRALEEDDAARARLEASYAEVASWGNDARALLPTGFERYSELIQVWDTHARLAPAPEVLQTLAQLHVERRDAIVEAFREGAQMMLRMGPLTGQVMRLAPLDVAAVYLRHGDLASAITHVRAMGDGGETEGRLLRVLERARGDDEAAADALVELGEAYREVRPATGRGICREGARRFPEDARFPTCLARIASEASELDAAVGYYAHAIDLAPDVRGLYDEALLRLDSFLGGGIDAQDTTRARALARRAESLLAARTERWPNAAPPVPAGRIQLLVGTVEMHAGNPEEAQRHLRASLSNSETPDALLQLGRLEEQTGSASEAVRHYRRALDLTPNTSPLDTMRRAQILESLGDAFTADGNADQSRRMYQQALEAWERVAPELAGAEDASGALARLQLRQGVLRDRLGDHTAAVGSFRQAMRTAPQMREIYATILAHLAAVAEPDPAFADEVFTLSQNQLTLAVEWKVYFALWVRLIAARAGTADPATVADAGTVLRTHADGSGWSSKLAAFSLGQLPYAELLQAASGVGEETEAHFYEGARRLERGDVQGARELFQRVLATHMVSFYEFTMARQLLASE